MEWTLHRDESVADEMCPPHFTVTQKTHDFADEEGQRYRDVDHVGRELLTSHSLMTLIGFRDRCFLMSHKALSNEGNLHQGPKSALPRP